MGRAIRTIHGGTVSVGTAVSVFSHPGKTEWCHLSIVESKSVRDEVRMSKRRSCCAVGFETL